MARSKGPNGRGTIFQDKHGIWWAQLRADDFGKRPKARAETEAGAVEQLILLEQKRARRLKFTDSRQTLTQFLYTWLQDVVQSELKASTAADYTYIVEHYIIPYLGRIRLCDLGVAHVRRWLNTLRTQPVKVVTKKKPATPRVLALSTIRVPTGGSTRRWAWHCLSRLVIENVATLVELPEAEPREMHPFTAG